MADVVKVYMRPVWVGGNAGYRYDLEHDGRIVVERSKVPLCDAARWCAGEGKNGKVEVWRYGGSGPAMIAEIERYAALTVRETETVSPRFVKWRPFDRDVKSDDVITSSV
jgi:hypothetical protein